MHFDDQFQRMQIDQDEGEPMGLGFDVVPQPGGKGLAWMDRPPFGEDYWTGIPAPGTRIVRWRDGVILEIPRAVQAMGHQQAVSTPSSSTPCRQRVSRGLPVAPRRGTARRHMPSPSMLLSMSGIHSRVRVAGAVAVSSLGMSGG